MKEAARGVEEEEEERGSPRLRLLLPLVAAVPLLLLVLPTVPALDVDIFSSSVGVGGWVGG